MEPQTFIERFDEANRKFERAAKKMLTRKTQEPPPAAFHMVSTGHARNFPVPPWWRLEEFDASLAALWGVLCAITLLVLGTCVTPWAVWTKLYVVGAVLIVASVVALVTLWRYAR